MHKNVVTRSFCSDSNTSQFQLVEEANAIGTYGRPLLNPQLALY